MEDCRRRLGKKATFEAALADLQSALADNPSLIEEADFNDTVQRSFTVLKSRYSGPAFWSAGRKLYQAVQVSFCTDFMHRSVHGSLCNHQSSF
jgi:hypothetical protein